MSSSFKYNLMDNDDFLLISTENDLKKEDVKINVANVDENKPGETTKSPAKNVYFPYKRIIKVSQYLIYVAIVLFGIYETYKSSRSVDRIVTKIFLEPCNATTVISMDEMEKVKNVFTTALNKMNVVNSDVTYNISTFTNDEYLSQKFENLTEVSTHKIEEQKEVRLIRYKMNLEIGCRENSILKKYLYFYKTFANGIHAYIVAASTLLFISFYYISKAKKCELSDEQQKECEWAYYSSELITICHFSYIIVKGIFLYFESCTVTEGSLGRFSI